MGDWVGVQGLVKVAKNAKTSPIMSVTPWNSKSKTKKYFFRSHVEDLLIP